MGYDVHITNGDWWDEGAPRISEEQWRHFVAAEPDLTPTGEVAEPTPVGETISYSNPLLAIWEAHPDGTPVPFAFRKGRIVVKNPDEPVLEKMRSIARALGARVQGDEGEFYG